jgi:hypothetical protein
LKIKAVEGLKGELVLASINKSLRANQEITINDEAFNQHDVQAMLKSGRIFVSEGTPPTTGGPEERFTIESTYGRVLALPSILGGVSPGRTYSVTRKQLESLDVKHAIDLGLIRNLGAEEPPRVDPKPPKASGLAAKSAAKKAIKPAGKKRAIPEDEGDDLQMLDPADTYHLTGEAKTIVHERQPPQNPIPKQYDPRPRNVALQRAENAVRNAKGTARAIKPAGRARNSEGLGGDGVDVTIL